MIKNLQSRRAKITILILLVAAIAALATAAAVRHHPHQASSPSQNSPSSETIPNSNLPPSLPPGAENVRAQPLFDANEVHHLNTDPSVSPASINPSSLKTAYSIPTTPGGAGTIAVVAAYDHPLAEQDLNTFSSFFSLRACTSAGGCFEKHKMAAGLDVDAGWAMEISLDTQWAHAIAPNSRILLVEAKSNLISDLMNAVDYARSRLDVVAVSLSWGAPEFNGETSYDSRLASSRGVQFFAAAGDSGHGVWWPAAAPTVIGVGGTSLSLNNDGSVQSEVAWSGGGGGLSVYETEPAYQLTYNITGAGGARATPDVAYMADPNPGVPIYLSVPYSGQTGWFTTGGTSAGTPQWAALQAIGRRINSSRLYVAGAAGNSSSYFKDITSGNNGACGALCNASSGYDYITGLGTPLTTRF
jgi:subtilase family serine protease